MISKKNVTASLIALSTVFAAFSAGCIVAPSQSMDLEAQIYDALGNPMTTYFDYYLNIKTTDGANLTYVNSASVDGGSGPVTDLNGVWTFSEGNLMFYTNPTGQTCADTCVTWDSFGCTEYATDCYDTADIYQLDTNTILTTNAQIGIDTGNDYLLYNSTQNFGSFSASETTFVQNDEFDTNILVVGGATAAKQTVAAEQVKGHNNNAPSKFVVHAKPVKLASIPAEKMGIVLKSRTAIESAKKIMAAKAANATAAK